MIKEIKLFDEIDHDHLQRMKSYKIHRTSTHDVFLFFLAITLVSGIVSSVIIIAHQ